MTPFKSTQYKRKLLPSNNVHDVGQYDHSALSPETTADRVESFVFELEHSNNGFVTKLTFKNP